MKATPNQPDPNEREELARLLPKPVERDLPSDRHRNLQEFVMSEIHQDLRSDEQAPRRTPKRRFAFAASALTAVAATAVAAVVIGTAGSGTSGGGHVPPTVPAPAPALALSGQQILLAAATTAERTPAGSGTYWHTKLASTNSQNGDAYQFEYWARRDGHQQWFRGDKSGGKVIELGGSGSTPFRLGGAKVTVEQLEKLPTEPAALKAWIADYIKHSDVRTSAGKLDATMQEQATFYGLVGLISQLPAPSGVRAAAFRAIAAYPNVESLGAVDGGQGLQISSGKDAARLVVDPTTSQVTKTDYFVTNEGAIMSAGEGGSFTLSSEWTDVLPK